MKNKPNWESAPKEAEILVRDKSGHWRWGTFKDASYSELSEGWIGKGKGAWHYGLSIPPSEDRTPYMEKRPSADLKFDQGKVRLDLASTKRSEVVNIKGNGMKELNNEIKLTLNLMQGDIDDGAHGELQSHLYSLLEIKRNEIQKCLAETS